MKTNFSTVTAYIKSFDKASQLFLNEIRSLITENFPEATESISYSMPAYHYLKKPLVYFAGYKKHIGLYAMPNTHKKFTKALQGYKQGKGSVQFPLNESLPLALIKQMVAFRKKEIIAAQKTK
jgi:uncharacterized protein YdhG (YjbR/CyaY superfamily)